MIRPLQFVCLVIVLSSANLGVAQTIEQIDTTLARQYYEQGNTRTDAQEYDSALLYFEKAEKLYEEGHYWAQYIDCLNRKGHVLNVTGQYSIAHNTLQQSLHLSLQHLGKNHKRTAQSYDQLGWNQFYTQKYDEALQSYSTALEIFSGIDEDDIEIAKMHINIGNVYRRKYMPAKAIEYTLKGVDLLTAIGQDTSKFAASAYNGLGATYASMEEFDKALAYHQKALPLFQLHNGENSVNVAGSYFNIGNIYADRGDNTTALDYYHKALQIDIRLFGEDHAYVAGDYESIGICYIQKGDTEMGRAYFQKSLEIARAAFGENNIHTAGLYDHVGASYNNEKNYAQAQVYYQKSLNILKEIGEDQSPQIASLYNNLGNTTLELDHAEDALSYQQEALKVYLKLEEVWQSKLGETYGYMGNCYEEMENYTAAMDYYKKDLEVRLRTVGQNHPEVAYVYGNMGNVFRKTHRFSESLAAYQQALQVLFTPLDIRDIYQNPVADQTLNPYILYEVLTSKALALREYAEHGLGTLDDLRFSLETYQLAANTLDETRKSLQTNASKNLLAENSVEYFENALETAWLLYEQTGEKEFINQAFLLAEKSKSVALMEALKETEARKFANIPAEVLSQERDLKVDLAYFKRKLFEEQQNQQPSQSAIESYQDKIFVLKNSYDSLIHVMEEKFPKYYQLKYNTDITSVAQVQQELLHEDALLTYFIGENNIYTFAINGNEATFFRTQKDSTFDQHIAVVRSVIADKTNNIEDFASSANALYNTLVATAEPLIQGKKLIIVPDGMLSYLPFGVLLKSSSGNAGSSFYNLPYLIKDHQVAYAYSATLWHESLKPRQKKPGTHYLAFAPTFNQKSTSPAGLDATPLLASADIGRGSLASLEGTMDEVNAIADHFEGQFYEGATASEQLFKEYAPNYDIIHLATHAIIDDVHPMNSRLLFSLNEDSVQNANSPDESAQDGNLYAWELYNMQLNAQMAVLSACNTGFGKLQRGEGVMSLGRAFAYAGCPSIIMSLWPAQDQATADIMVNFYQGLSAGMTKDEALQKAKLKYLENTDELFAHPFYWASFVVQGDSAPLNTPYGMFSYWWLGGGLALVLLSVGLFIRYRK